MALLDIKNLSLKFGGIDALKKISISVDKASFVGLIGPNGAGKTTLVNCISRLHDPHEGTIEFEGQDLLKLKPHELTQAGITRTFQDLSFFDKIEDIFVIDYLKLGQFDPKLVSVIKDGFQLPSTVAYEKNLKQNARVILDFFRQLREHMEPPEVDRDYPSLFGREGFPDLQDLEYAPISSLSFAWRRRLDLIRALISKPKLLLLDEPAQGLAPSEIENLGKTLKIIKSEFGVSALIIEHNVETLMKISDHLCAMNYGQLIAQGTPEEIKTNKEVIEIYLGKSNQKPAASAAISSSSTPSQPLLEVKKLDCYYGAAQALFSVSAKIYPNQVYSILGTNGSGKSTLVKTIAGVEKARFGEIIFKGETLPLGWPEIASERGIQFVPQGHIIFPELTVLENLRIGSFKLKSKQLNEAFERIYSYFGDLKALSKTQAASLSGGQQQMLAMAQALMTKPEILLLDEPSLGLSPMLVEKIFDIIKRIKTEENCAVVIVEQNVAKALEVSDYIFMISSGMLIAEGPSHQFSLDGEVVKKYLGFR